MARKPSPWYWPERNGWYTILHGQRHHLLDQPEDAPPPKKRGGKWVIPTEVDQVFHTLLAAPAEQNGQPQSDPSEITVAELFDKYLDWLGNRTSEGSKAQRTYDWYHDHIQGFINFKSDVARLPVSALRPYHVVEWVDSHGEDWSPAYRRGAIIAIQRPFNWAEELGYIPTSPIKRIPKPQPQRREQFITPDTWAKIRDHYDEGDPFRDLLEFSWESGCRPQESKRIEPRHVELAQHRIVFPAAESKGKRFCRVIWLTPKAEEIIRCHLEHHHEGPIFCNEDNQPWTAQAMACRFGRLEKHLGEKFCATAFRHGFCQDMLEQTKDVAATAALMGHRSTRMVSEVYSHMDQADSHLDRVLKSRADRSHDGKTR